MDLDRFEHRSEVTEEDLVCLARKGDSEAFSGLVRKYMRLVFSFAYRMTGNHADADEMAQQTFINVYQNFEKFQPGTKFRSWILTITTNLCTDLRRRKAVRREVPLGDRPKASKWTGDPASAVLKDETSRSVWKALDTLPPDQRAVLVLHAMEEIPLVEIARSMTMPEGTIRWKYFEARRKMRAIIARFPLSGGEENAEGGGP